MERWQESEFIFINKGYDYCKSESPFFILEIGFGTRFKYTSYCYKEHEQEQKKVQLYFNWKNILSMKKIDQHSSIITSFAGINGKEILNLIHSVPWNISVNIAKNSLWKKKFSLIFTLEKLSGNYGSLFTFDAFGPGKTTWKCGTEGNVFKKSRLWQIKNGIPLWHIQPKGESKRKP